MIHAKKELDLLRSYRRLMRGEKGRSGLLHHFLTPAAVCLLVCVLIWGVLMMMNSSLSSLTDDVNDWLLDPAVTQQYSEAADRQQYNDRLVQALGQVQADGSASPAEGADQTGEAPDAPQTDGSAAPAEDADQTGEAPDAPQTDGGVYIGTATLSAQGDVSQWLHFLDEVERSCKGLRVTNFSISDYDYVENNTQAVSTSLITGTLEIYLCGSGREADA